MVKFLPRESLKPGKFCLIVNDCGTLVGYVDDGAYSFAHTNPAILSQVLTRKYGMLEDWMNSNKLVVNPDKTHLMVMGTRKSAAQRRGVSLQAGNFTILPTETEELLGGTLSSP